MADRPLLEAVVFDAGGTLLRIDFEWVSGMLAGLGIEASAAELRRAEGIGRRRFDQSVGTRGLPGHVDSDPPRGPLDDLRAYYAGMLEGAHVRHPVLEEAVERMFERGTPPNNLWARPMEGAREALDALLARGVRLACVSNADGRAEQLLVQGGVRDGLEFVIDSHVVGIEKPDPAIFRLALGRLGVTPQRAVYVGDIRSVDERGARSAGMHFVLVDGTDGYAGPDSPSIRGLAELPAVLERDFELVATPRRA